MVILIDVCETFASEPTVIPYSLFLVSFIILIRDNHIRPVPILFEYLSDGSFVFSTERFKHAVLHEIIKLPPPITDVVRNGIVVVESPQFKIVLRQNICVLSIYHILTRRRLKSLFPINLCDTHGIIGLKALKYGFVRYIQHNCSQPRTAL